MLGFERPVEPLDLAVGLRMERACFGIRNLKKGEKRVKVIPDILLSVVVDDSRLRIRINSNNLAKYDRSNINIPMRSNSSVINMLNLFLLIMCIPVVRDKLRSKSSFDHILYVLYHFFIYFNLAVKKIFLFIIHLH